MGSSVDDSELNHCTVLQEVQFSEIQEPPILRNCKVRDWYVLCLILILQFRFLMLQDVELTYDQCHQPIEDLSRLWSQQRTSQLVRDQRLNSKWHLRSQQLNLHLPNQQFQAIFLQTLFLSNITRHPTNNLQTSFDLPQIPSRDTHHDLRPCDKTHQRATTSNHRLPRRSGSLPWSFGVYTQDTRLHCQRYQEIEWYPVGVYAKISHNVRSPTLQMKLDIETNKH